MPAAVTDWGASQWLQSLFGLVATPTEYFVALATEEPGLDADGTTIATTEPTDAGYQRQSYGVGTANWGANGADIVNLNDIRFGAPSAADWGFLTHFVLLDAAADGDIYAYGEFLSPQYVEVGYGFVIPAGTMIIDLSSLEDTIAL